ncbi:related to ERG6 - Delta(24)-sterol C-methyltransferase [Pseudozyma flocculosa]|uniref:Related to ERG6 - Delta(24)-sterol C-methyltransferase n=1 Tax=Pseudozyma flocculosa TaxID=84751 RepID=A0A5C3F154_9BASI|nr:related to ERG6 - Delta(24)-sterol C-methyltransferase [Pseudozyma flocculosa]
MMANSGQRYHRSDNAEAYRQNASFVYSPAYTSPVLGLLDAKAGERSGELTLDVARLISRPEQAATAAGHVLGIDASADMIDKATRLRDAAAAAAAAAAAQQGDPDGLGDRVKFRVLDGHELATGLGHDLEGTFDKVFSNAALHWMKASPSQVIRGVRTALKRGGVFAAEMGGFLNCIGIRALLHQSCRRRGVDPDAVDPWFFPTAEQYSALLIEGGFEVRHCELVPRLTALPPSSGLRGWLSTFAGPFLNAFDDEGTRGAVLDEVEAALRPDCYDAAEDRWSIMYVRLRIRAVAV